LRIGRKEGVLGGRPGSGVGDGGGEDVSGNEVGEVRHFILRDEYTVYVRVKKKRKEKKRICRLEGRAEEMVVVENQGDIEPRCGLIFKRELLPAVHVFGRITCFRRRHQAGEKVLILSKQNRCRCVLVLAFARWGRRGSSLEDGAVLILILT